MSNEKQNKPAPALGPAVMRLLGRELRVFMPTSSPKSCRKHFAEILHKLDEPSGEGENMMTLILRKQHAEDPIDGQEPPPRLERR
jgi:hypothetical protein